MYKLCIIIIKVVIFKTVQPLCLVGCSRVFLDVVYIRTRLCLPAWSPRWSSTAGLGPGVCMHPSASSTCYSVSLPDQQKQQQRWNTRQDESNSTTNVIWETSLEQIHSEFFKKISSIPLYDMDVLGWRIFLQSKRQRWTSYIIHETLLKYCWLMIGMKWEISQLEINQKWGLNSEELLLLLLYY